MSIPTIGYESDITRVNTILVAMQDFANTWKQRKMVGNLFGKMRGTQTIMKYVDSSPVWDAGWNSGDVLMFAWFARKLLTPINCPARWVLHQDSGSRRWDTI